MTPPAKFRRMPALLHLYFVHVRKTPGCWVTTPWGIMVPRLRWDNDSWRRPELASVRSHELTHWGRLVNRPYLSRLWWAVHYCLSKRMAYDEEILAYRVELMPLGYQERQRWAQTFALGLITDYGFDKPLADVELDLLAGLP